MWIERTPPRVSGRDRANGWTCRCGLMIMATRVLRAALLAMALAPAALSNVCAWYPGSCTANAM